MPEWVVPVIIACVGSGGLGAVLVAFINNKGSQQVALLNAMQANREADSKENQRLDKKIDSLYDMLHLEREYSMEWEGWHAAGMPDPPGRPRRKIFAHNEGAQ